MQTSVPFTLEFPKLWFE